jgi:alkanesulfonate monooxygenase SsuD/methylene tetrahydromethanopterin reductase-like flavin-dependent oxidoreductase (luciferase family)
MDLCVMIEGQEDVTWPQWRALAGACEEHGVSALFRSDHYLSVEGLGGRGSLDAWGTLCGLAALTSTLRLGTLVSPATFRHPSVLAKLAATADHISGGRIEVGMGAGWLEAEHRAYGFPFADTRTRMEVFAEQVEIVRGLWEQGTFSYAGAHYRLDGVDALPKPVQPRMPLIVGGRAGAKGAAIAARAADEYNTVYVTPDEARARRAAVEDAWDDAGRDPASLRFSVMTGCLVAGDESALLERAGRLAERRATGRSAEAELAEVTAGPWIAGTPDEAGARLRALADAGVDRVMLQLFLHDELDQIKLIANLKGSDPFT